MSNAKKAFEIFYATELLAKTPRAADTNKVLRADDVVFRLKWDGEAWAYTLESDTIYTRLLEESPPDAEPVTVTDFIADDPWEDLLEGEPAWMKIEFADAEKKLVKYFVLRRVS